MRSIIQPARYRLDRKCFLCEKLLDKRTFFNLECHHIFDGPNRKHSNRLGLTVYLCHQHHNEPPHGVHHNKENMEYLQKIGQRAYEQEDWSKHPSAGTEYAGHPIGSREAFVAEFGKNYLGDEKTWENVEKEEQLNPEQFMKWIQ